MGLTINTNTVSMSAQRSLEQNKENLDLDLKKNATGYRITCSADDAAGLSVSEYFRSRNVSLEQATRNANDGVSLVQIVEGGLNEIGNILIRLRELSIQASSDTVDSDGRRFIETEANQLRNEINRIAATTNFNGKKLLKAEGEGSLDLQVGIYANKDSRIGLDTFETNTQKLGIGNIDLSSKFGAQNSISLLTEAQNKVGNIRSGIGGMSSRMNAIISNNKQSSREQQSCISRIKDADIAQTASSVAKDSILIQSSSAILSQANSSYKSALKLL